MIKVHAHTAFTSRSGYASHARDFFTALNKHVEVKVNDPYSGDYPMTPEQNMMLEYKRLQSYPWEYGKHFNTDMWSEHSVVDIILSTTGSSDFYQNFRKHKIAFNVWESTRQPDDFFKQLLEYDHLWVPSKWQRDCSILQGYPPDRVFVVPEGIDLEKFKPVREKTSKSTQFQFIVIGKWEYRKSTTEIIQAFLNVFRDYSSEQVKLVLLADNSWPVDEFHSTEERIEGYGLSSDKIEIIHYASDAKYLELLQNSDCFLSCSRSEGWNIPLMEAIACGIPTIATNWGAPLDFCGQISHLVNIKTFKQPEFVYGYEQGTCPGVWAEPDFSHLETVIRNVYNDYENAKSNALKKIALLEEFTWDKIAKQANELLEKLVSKPHIVSKTSYNVSFNDGCRVTIIGNDESKSEVSFFDKNTKELIYKDSQSCGFWTGPNKKYYTEWLIQILTPEGNIQKYEFDVTNRNVLILFDSSALGDTIAWMPYAEEFRKKHNCNVTIRTFHNYLFKNSYPDINFTDSWDSSKYYATYRIGVYDDDKDGNKNKNNWKTVPLQMIASDILGLDYLEIPAKIDRPDKQRPVNKRYVTISESGSTKAKKWNYEDGWQHIVDYLNSIGYEVAVISKEPTELKNVIDLTNRPMSETINNIYHSEFYIGCGSGPSWLANALGKTVVLISGFSQPYTEFLSNCYRVINTKVCHGCYNKPEYHFDRSWEWCPAKKDFECTKSIHPDEIINKINKIKLSKEN